MATANNTRIAFGFPKMKYKFKTPTETDRFNFYDIKFYPYAPPPNDEPIFAMVSQKKVYIGRLSLSDQSLITMHHELVDEQEENDPNSLGLNSCTWCYIDQQGPLLAVAGGSGQLKLINALEGTIFATLTGHGYGTINDMATHPFYPWIVATASMDKSLRIWDIRRHANPHDSPTIIICGQATGHCEGVLTVSWHPCGRYIITGGHDERVCVWTLPDLGDKSTFWQEISATRRERSSHEVRTIYYPHFVSSAVHSNFVDCIRFFGDLVISKAANESKIVIWRITGFDSRRPPPNSDTSPKTEEHLDTRNGFIRKAIRENDGGIVTVEVAPEYRGDPLYERILELETPKSEQFYLRFGVLMPSTNYPDRHPMLAFGNTLSELRFWDLERLSLGHAGDGNKPTLVARKSHKGTARPVRPSDRLSRLSSTPQLRESPLSTTSYNSSSAWPRQNSTEATSEISDEITAPQGLERDREKYPLHEPHKPIKAHAKISLIELQFKNMAFTTRAADWSPCGKWCVVVGESAGSDAGVGGFAVFYRPL
ncbi:uncharacterized protein A1O9_05606 [Exophiala aquamarina CBS 119918]|uniref:Uncharacterized protein n=1 Tax=Exophiala aquamarina CBS 119918 TaxID=1182545 RepID=A0A072PEH6_9EURO|nr:uncharacterized protein A1O9_05606 [Exophiala aquamarina CBS 119918]KEF57688.1 hypothetical protein A1O9_05606 [Exophiala aquamarina CBS 119918]